MQSFRVSSGVYRDMAWEIKKIQGFLGSHFCGYVTLPNDHVLRDFPDTLMLGCGEDTPHIPVHGGITFDEVNKLGDRVIGFDCAHLCDFDKPKGLDFVSGEIRKLINHLLDDKW